MVSVGPDALRLWFIFMTYSLKKGCTKGLTCFLLNIIGCFAARFFGIVLINVLCFVLFSSGGF